MREALGRLVVVVSEERTQGRGVPSLIVDIAEIIESGILRSARLPSRGATVAAPVFNRLRRAARAKRTTAAAVPRDVFGLPSASSIGAYDSLIVEARAWLDEAHVGRAFVHAGAPFARRWLKETLDWASTNPDAKPPQLPLADPLAPPPEQGGLQPGASKRGRRKGSIALSSKTRDLALLALYLVEVEGVSPKAATRRICDMVAKAYGVRPDIDDLREAREELKMQGITPDELTCLAQASVEHHVLPESVRGLGPAAVRRKATAMLRCLVMPGKNSHPLQTAPRS